MVERLEPETETAANKESGSTELDEAAATIKAAKEEEWEKIRKKKQRRQIRKEAAATEGAASDTMRAGEVVVEKAATTNSLEAAALAVSWSEALGSNNTESVLRDNRGGDSGGSGSGRECSGNANEIRAIERKSRGCDMWWFRGTCSTGNTDSR